MNSVSGMSLISHMVEARFRRRTRMLSLTLASMCNDALHHSRAVLHAGHLLRLKHAAMAFLVYVFVRFWPLSKFAAPVVCRPTWFKYIATGVLVTPTAVTIPKHVFGWGAGADDAAGQLAAVL